MLDQTHIHLKFQLNKNKTLYTNGCSLTFGTDSVPTKKDWTKHSWPSYLAKLTGYRLFNHAVENCSNQSIRRRTMQDIYFIRPEVAIICWTNSNRFEIELDDPVSVIEKQYRYDDNGDHFVQCTVWGLDNNLYDAIPGLKNKVIDGFDRFKDKNDHTRCIKDIKSFCKDTSTKLIMFNGYDATKKDVIFPNEDLYHHVIGLGYKTTSSGHFTKEVNQYWAKKLYTHLTEETDVLL